MNRKESRIITRNLKRSLRLPPLPWAPADIQPLNRGQKPKAEGVIIVEPPEDSTHNSDKKSA